MRRALTGLGAIIALSALLVGLPAVLIVLGPNPLEGIITNGTFTFERFIAMLLAPDDGRLVLAVIKALGWIVWAALAISVLLEVIGQLRQLRTPSRRAQQPKSAPGLALPQSMMRPLVAAVIALFIAAPALTGTANAAPTEPVTPVHAHIQQQHTTAPAPVVAAPQTKAETTTTSNTHSYIVQTGDSLWSIAEKQLGDPMRWSQIAELNRDLITNDSDFLISGWELQLPTPPAAAPATAPTSASAAVSDTVTVADGDTLSSLAATHLGNPLAWPQLYQASLNIPQPGGYKLTDPNIISTGWTISLGTHTNTTTAPIKKKTPPKTTLTHTHKQTPATTKTPSTAPSVAAEAKIPVAVHTNAPAATTAPTQNTTTPAENPIQPAQTTTDQNQQQQSAASIDDGTKTPWVAYAATGVGALLAGGVVALIASRRRNQQRLRKPGQRIPMPQDDTAHTETMLRTTADPISITDVDAALRTLAQHCEQTNNPLPQIRAARLTADAFDIFCTEPVDYLPAPWIATADNAVWTLQRDNLDALEHDKVANQTAPYPALVTIGHDADEGHLLINLECLGSFGINGEPELTREILAAIALELATSSWADDLQVTIVGAFPEMEDIFQTGRISYVPTATRVLEKLTQRANHDRQELHNNGTETLQKARVTGTAPDAWTPEIVLLAGEITPDQHTEITTMVAATPRMAIATVTIDGNNFGPWHLTTNTPEQATLEPAGIQIRPQRITAEDYQHLLEVAALADIEELEEAPFIDQSPQPNSPEPTTNQTTPNEPALENPTPSNENNPTDETAHTDTAPETDAVIVEFTHPNTPKHPHITMLGPVDVLSARGTVETGKRARLLEFLAFLALHPGAHRQQIDDAIWPHRRDGDNLNTRNTATSKLRRWLGNDDTNCEYLPRHTADEGYRLSDSVTNDIAVWDQLMQQRPLSASTSNLRQALQLVRGIPFEGHHPRRYAWAETTKQRLIAEIVDAAWELAKREMNAGRWQQCDQACATGLRLEPAHEHLWRIRIIAARAAGHIDEEKEAINRLLSITDALEVDLQPETNRLLQALEQTDPDVTHLMATAL